MRRRIPFRWYITITLLFALKTGELSAANPVTFTAPVNDATVSGLVTITLTISPKVAWLRVYVDGSRLPRRISTLDSGADRLAVSEEVGSSGAMSSTGYSRQRHWNSVDVADGTHTISAKAYESMGTLLGQASVSVNVQNSTRSGVPRESHVFLLLEENHSFADVTPSSMPYLTSLENKAAIATNYFANTHPSLPNYMWLTTGGDGGFTNDVCPTATSVDNIVRDLTAAGLTWKAYEESIPSVGYLGCDSGSYMAHHDTFAYFSDVRNDPSQAQNIVPFSQLATDIQNGTLPSFGFITPNVDDDAHSGTLAQVDSWLQTNIGPLLNSAPFQPGGHGLLIIVFDEGTDNTNGGGQVFWLAIGPEVKPGYSTANFFQHENTLKLIADALNFAAPGSAVNADDMAEVF